MQIEFFFTCRECGADTRILWVGDNVLDRDARTGSYRELGLAPLGRARDGPGPGAGDG